MEDNIQGAAEKISVLLNPKDQQETETKPAEPSESTTEEQSTEPSQAESEAAPKRRHLKILRSQKKHKQN